MLREEPVKVGDFPTRAGLHIRSAGLGKVIKKNTSKNYCLHSHFLAPIIHLPATFTSSAHFSSACEAAADASGAEGVQVTDGEEEEEGRVGGRNKEKRRGQRQRGRRKSKRSVRSRPTSRDTLETRHENKIKIKLTPPQKKTYHRPVC